VAETLRRLVVVESPTKMRTVAQALGKGFEIAASAGHVRDLPTSAAEVPAKYKGQPWARTGVNVEKDFEPIYVVATGKQKVIRDIKAKLADVDELWLATDEDREGESIAWHLLQVLKPKVPVKRLVFHEITPSAISAAVDNLRDLNVDKVDAQETRRILDRLYGYEVSPVLWKKVMPKLSAGRVQSVATRMVVDRERERLAFRAADYAGITAVLDAGAQASPRRFTANLFTAGDLRIATGRDFDSVGKVAAGRLHLDVPQAEMLAEKLQDATFEVESVESKAYRRRPYEPFRTTTLQQEAGRKLGFTAQRTMKVAQGLYERGFITYMRTDSITLSATAVKAARTQAAQLFGSDSVPEKPRHYYSKVKNAQEAHEAIRPAGDSFRIPKSSGLSGDELRLYELIWKRTLASQMKDAEGLSVNVKVGATTAAPVELADVSSGETGKHHRFGFQATGRTITFLGFLAAYVASVDDGDADDKQDRIPELQAGQPLAPAELNPEGHQTQPPARYTEESLIEKLESQSIGRPSTYATIIATITARDYVFKKGRALVPTWLAFAVTQLLERHFTTLVDYAFTAEMEERLDEIEAGETSRLAVLKEFYYGPQDGVGLHQLVGELGDIDAKAISSFQLDESGIYVRVGRYGTYLEDADGRRANVDPDLPPDELTLEMARELLAQGGTAERQLGTSPDGVQIVAKDGRYGPYVTEVLGPDAPKSAKPRISSLFKSMSVDTVTLAQALELLTLPRVVGKDEAGVEITAANGRYGPYIKRGADTRSLATEEELLTITAAEALALLAAPKAARGRAGSAAAARTLGKDPQSGKSVLLKDGKYGPYVTDGEVNATLRRGDEPDEVTLQRALELLADKRAKGPSTRRRPAAKKKK
jgi:DNA topoisomerase-1